MQPRRGNRLKVKHQSDDLVAAESAVVFVDHPGSHRRTYQTAGNEQAINMRDVSSEVQAVRMKTLIIKQIDLNNAHSQL